MAKNKTISEYALFDLLQSVFSMGDCQRLIFGAIDRGVLKRQENPSDPSWRTFGDLGTGTMTVDEFIKDCLESIPYKKLAEKIREKESEIVYNQRRLDKIKSYVQFAIQLKENDIDGDLAKSVLDGK